jgi:preprotein translocase subunit SecB
MAKDTTGTGEKAQHPQTQKAMVQAPTLNILAQYVKDLSFENPGAPSRLVRAKRLLRSTSMSTSTPTR